jgi:hypothetical protein
LERILSGTHMPSPVIPAFILPMSLRADIDVDE